MTATDLPPTAGPAAEERLAAYMMAWPLLTVEEARRELGLATAFAAVGGWAANPPRLIRGVPGRPGGVRVVAGKETPT